MKNLPKKIILSSIYPLWFFLSKTWFGNMIMIPISFMPTFVLVGIIFPGLLNSIGEAKGAGVGVGMLALLISPFVGGGFMKMGDYLEKHYAKWNYKIEMRTKMI